MNAFDKNTELFIKPDLGGKYKHWTHDWHSNKIFTFFWNGLRFTLYKFSLYMKPQKSGKMKILKKNSFKEHNFIENADIKHCKKL